MNTPIDLFQGMLVGVGACAVYQAVIAIQMMEKDGYWPWHNPNKPLLDSRNFIAVSVVRLIIAGCLVWLFITTGQVSGQFGVAALGAVADEMVLRLVEIGRKAYKDEQAA
jgi:hypothetical protein